MDLASARKPSWKDRLTSVSKKFGVGASPTRQYTACERDREGGEEGEKTVVSGKKGRESDVDVDEWCVLTLAANGSARSVVCETREQGEEGEGVAILHSADPSEEANMEQTDGLLDRFRGSRKSDKLDTGKGSVTSSPTPPGVGGHGSRKSSFGSRLKPEKVTRPGSPQPLQRRSSGRGRPRLDPHDHHHANGHASPRSASPSRSSSGPASIRRKQSSSNPPSRTESPNLAEPRRQHDVPTGLSVRQTQSAEKNGRGSPASSPSGESAFAKVRDTLKISKAKKKSKKKKGAAYSVDPVEITFTDTKYQDPFEAPSYTDSLEVGSKAQSHDFKPVSIPHHKPEYCDHCGDTAWGLYRQVLKCSICDFIVHRKCESIVKIDCSSRLERAVLQRDQIVEENATAEEEDNEKERKALDATSHVPVHTDQHDPVAAPTPSLSSSSSSSYSSSHHTNPQVLSEKAKLAKKIREYNRKTTPVNHIHIKGAHCVRDGAIEYVGFVRVHMCVQRPIHVSTAITRTSWYRLMRPVKERSDDAGLETAFYLPTDTNRLVHITNTTTTKELVQILLKKFCITDNPKKFSLYEEYGGDYRRLFEEDNPLVISLEASVNNRNSKLILRDNTYSTIQWEAFTHPELNNFILILRREEELYVDKMAYRFQLWKECISQAMKEKCKEEISMQTYLGNDTRNGAKASPSLLDSRTTKA